MTCIFMVPVREFPPDSYVLAVIFFYLITFFLLGYYLNYLSLREKKVSAPDYIALKILTGHQWKITDLNKACIGLVIISNAFLVLDF